MTRVRSRMEVVEHEISGFPAQDQIEVFLHSGYYAAAAAEDTAAVEMRVSSGIDPDQRYRAAVDLIPESATLAILTENRGARRSLEYLNERATRHRQVIVAPLGPEVEAEACVNQVAVVLPDADPVLLDKISFSADDLDWSRREGKPLLRGKQFHVFRAEGWKLAVLNCHEYTDADLITSLLRERIDIVVVTSRNKASQMYAEYAGADIHRLFCFIVVNNVSDYGGSGVYAPFSRLANGKNAIRLGGRLFASRGPCEISARVVLPLGELRELREHWRGKPATEAGYQHIDPPESVKLSPGDAPYLGVLTMPSAIQEINLDAQGFGRERKGPVRIAVAQLRSMSAEAYLRNSYCISRSEDCESFMETVESHLELLRRSTEGRPAGHPPDILVFPEVFLPRGLEHAVKQFAIDRNTIVIAGVEYDPQEAEALYGTGDARGANRCRIYVPIGKEVRTYDYAKLTRSQYDAKYLIRSAAGNPTGEEGTFGMDRGNHLLRFSAEGLGRFGVLICYDLSHLEIVHAINFGVAPIASLADAPLDMLFVVAHNPNADLYRRCCLADCHRFFQYVVMCNVAQYGGSGVFGPLRTAGERRTLMRAGKNAEGIFCTDVDIEALRDARLAGDVPGSNRVTAALSEGEAAFQRLPEYLQRRFAPDHVEVRRS